MCSALVVSILVLSRFSGFLAQSKDMRLRLIGNSKLCLGVSVGGLVTAMDCQLVQAATPG